MSPLAMGPGKGPHRVLGSRTQRQCRVHKVPLLPPPAVSVLEEAASQRLADQARARLEEAGVDMPARPERDHRAASQPYCPQCVQELALAAVARLNGEDL